MATLVLFLSIVRFRIVPRRRMWERARRGDESILAQGTYRTEQRTGVLIFASVAQRYAEIIADPRINVEIESETWANVISTPISAIKDGRFGDGFVSAVNMGGEQQARHLPRPGHEIRTNGRTRWSRFEGERPRTPSPPESPL